MGPCLGVQGCTDPFFRPNINFRSGTVQFGRTGTGGHRRGHHNGGNSGAFIYSYPYYVPYPVAVPEEDLQGQPDAVYEEEPPAQTVFERRREYRPAPNPTPVGSSRDDDSRYGERTLDPRESRAIAPEPAASSDTHHEMSPTSRELVPVLLVFKDGHQQEIGNYAIVGDTLFDLGAFVAHKIKLADLDLKQTIDKNEQRGVEFNVPSQYKPKV
jgi:hypothetical protein